MNGLGVVAVVVGGILVAGSLCWTVVALALRRGRRGTRGHGG